MTTIVEQKIAREVSKILLSIGAVSINTKKPFKYASGIFSPMYTDNRLLISYPKAWRKIIDSYINVMNKIGILHKIDVFSGTATAAIPHAAALAHKLKKPMVYVRSNKKDHGKENQIEGIFPKKSRVLIVEDLISTGGSAIMNCLAVRDAGGIAKTCIAITTSTVNMFHHTMKEAKIRLITLTNVQTVLDVAVAERRISETDRTRVNEFLADPPNWGKRNGFV